MGNKVRFPGRDTLLRGLRLASKHFVRSPMPPNIHSTKYDMIGYDMI